MSNELKDIVNRLNGYSDEGWEVTSAQKVGGGWRLDVRPLGTSAEVAEPEVEDEDN